MRLYWCLVLRRFDYHSDLDMRGDVAVQLDRDMELAQLLERLFQDHLAAVQVEAFVLASRTSASLGDFAIFGATFRD